MNTTWAQVTRYYVGISANNNEAPAPKIKSGRHAGKVDLNALRDMGK